MIGRCFLICKNDGSCCDIFATTVSLRDYTYRCTNHNSSLVSKKIRENPFFDYKILEKIRSEKIWVAKIS